MILIVFLLRYASIASPAAASIVMLTLGLFGGFPPLSVFGALALAVGLALSTSVQIVDLMMGPWRG